MFHNELLIKRIKFDINIENKNDFDKIALNSSNIVNNHLPDVLQKIVDSIVTKNERLSINSIEIDIGEIDFYNINSFLDKFYTIFLKELKKFKNNNSYYPRSNELLIAYFLNFGYLPWWANSNEKFNNFISTNPYNKKKPQ